MPFPDHPHQGEPATAGRGPWRLLREAKACLHPGVAELQARVEAADGPAWLAAAVAGSGDDSPSSRLVADALVAAARFDGSAAANIASLDLDALGQIWSILAEYAPASAADVAAAATAALDHNRIPSPDPANEEPRRAGKYDLLRPIGLGSCGTVHEARHRDNGLLAAVKLLRLDTWDPVQVERFRGEARIIARLEHPSIVKVLDSGVEEIGGFAVPYLVSELVRGRRFCQATAGWPLVALLRSFAAVCDAVAHAHERGVLHRDLKSSNVLVDDAGLPHLLDFGIARMVEDSRASATQTGLLLGTPTAMSPEQASGSAVDACSEVWSLGALLFESLTGVPPHDLAGLTGISAIRRVAEQEPRRLEMLRPDLPRDVGAVIGKALARDRSERYATVQLLLDDVHRLAAGDPVLARQPSAWRILGHLVRRHRLLATSAATVLATVVGGAVAVSASWWRAEQARIETVAAMQRTLGFAGRLVEMATPSAELRRLLAESLAPVADQDLTTAADAMLRVEARLREYLGDIEHRSGNAAAAHDQRQRALDLELALQARGAGNRGDLARSLIKIADLDRVSDPDAVLPRFAQAHGLLSAIAAEPAATLSQLDDLGWSHERMAVEAIRRKDWVAAEQHTTAQIDLARRLLARSTDGLRHYGLGSALLTQVDALNERSPRPNTNPRILELYREACSHLRAAIAEDPERVAFLEKGAAGHIYMASALLFGGHPTESLTSVEPTRSWLRTLRALDPQSLRLGQLELRRLAIAAECHAWAGDQQQEADRYAELFDSLGEPTMQAAWQAEPRHWQAETERDAWLAGWHADHTALLSQLAERLRISSPHLPKDAKSTIALATLAEWTAPTDRPRAAELLETARQFLASLADDAADRASAQAAVATAERAITSVAAPQHR